MSCRYPQHIPLHTRKASRPARPVCYDRVAHTQIALTLSLPARSVGRQYRDRGSVMQRTYVSVTAWRGIDQERFPLASARAASLTPHRQRPRWFRIGTSSVARVSPLARPGMTACRCLKARAGFGQEQMLVIEPDPDGTYLSAASRFSSFPRRRESSGFMPFRPIKGVGSPPARG